MHRQLRVAWFLIGIPINIALVMVRKEDLPVRASLEPDAPGAQRAVHIESALGARLAEHICPGVDRGGGHLANRGERRPDPAQRPASRLASGQAESLLEEPQSDASRRAQLGEAREDVAQGQDDLLVWVEAHLAGLLAPDIADRQRDAQLAPSGLLAQPLQQACAEGVQLDLGKSAFKPKMSRSLCRRGW